MAGSVEARARYWLRGCYTTGTNLAVASVLTGLSRDVRNKTIGDIGAGASTISMELAHLGNETFVVDPRYNDPQKIRSNMHGLIARHEIHREIIETFFKDFGVNRRRYIAAMAGDMPSLSSNSLDIALSIKCFSTVLLNDLEVALQAFEEVLRVIKPYQGFTDSGLFLVHPWVGGVSASSVDKQNAAAFLKILDERRIPYLLQPVPQIIPMIPPRLVIAKPL